MLVRVSAADFSLAKVIDSNMVLQRAPVQAQLWGWVPRADTVTAQVVTCARDHVATT